jgi:demethylmenaquinone methyltransferase/2-methoxy-6-polyprenyl-1,4-benzoquinol methylase
MGRTMSGCRIRQDGSPLMTSPSQERVARGTCPEGAQTEAEASQHVREMFSRIAPRYDLLNHVLSLSLDRVWRRRTACRFSHILANREARVLDLCCGTGDLTRAMERVGARNDGGAWIGGVDFSGAMLTLAQQKARQQHRRCSFFAANALRLPLADGAADLVTAAFGFRNLVNYRQGLAEWLRVLRHNGEVGILEFCEPQTGVMAALYRAYCSKVLPRIGGAISGSSEAYAYLPASVARFPQPDELAGWMRESGFADVRYETWMFGAVALYMARRPQ